MKTSQSCIVDASFVPGEISCSIIDIIREEQRRRSECPDLFPIDQGSNSPLSLEYYESLGYKSVAISKTIEPSKLAVHASKKILDRNAIKLSDIDIFIYYDTNPHHREIHHNISTKVIADVGLTNVSFSTHATQKNCTSALYAVELASALLDCNPQYSFALVAGGDCVDVDEGQPRVVNGQIHGDAGSAILLGRKGRKISYLRNKMRPIAWKRFFSSRSEFNEIALKYLSWSLKEILEAKKIKDLTPENIAYLATNQKLLDKFARDRNFPLEKISFYQDHIRTYGNSQCHQIVNALEQVLYNVETESVFHVTGLGNTMSTMILDDIQFQNKTLLAS